MAMKMSTGALDDEVRLNDQMHPEIDYRRPPHGGDELFDLIGDFQGKVILDVGCGLAPFRARVEGIGASWIGLELAGNACSVVGDADSLPFRDGAFDGVLCSALRRAHAGSSSHRPRNEARAQR